jgi:hypothetical protein
MACEKKFLRVSGREEDAFMDGDAPSLSANHVPAFAACRAF